MLRSMIDKSYFSLFKLKQIVQRKETHRQYTRLCYLQLTQLRVHYECRFIYFIQQTVNITGGYISVGIPELIRIEIN
jgi:hypothetical protein